VKKVPKAKSNALDIEAYGKQLDFINNEDKHSAFLGGRGSGKSEAGAIKLLLYLLDYPGAVVMVVAPIYKTLWNSTLESIKKVFPPHIYKFYEQKREIILEPEYGGSKILLSSADNPDDLRGPNLAAFWLDEAAQMKPDVWKILVPTLRQSGRFRYQGWITGTPRGFNWIYQEFAREKRENYWMIQASAEENPFLPKGFIDDLRESYKNDPDFAFQELEGGFTVVGGREFFVRSVLESLDTPEPIETREGCIEIWKSPYVGGRYVAGCDPCWGETNSYGVATVLDWQTGEQVAKIRGRIQPDEMAQKFTDLCREYNNAYALAEVNGEGRHLVDKMLELDYGSRMYHRHPEWWAHEDKQGWHTNTKTRPEILSELEEAIRLRLTKPNSRNTIDEMMSFIRDEKGKTGASEGAYDDEVMAYAMAWHGRQYATFTTREEKVKVLSY